MKINFDKKYAFELNDCKLDTIIFLFTKFLPMILGDMFNIILLAFANDAMSNESKSFCCDKCGNTTEFSWKTRHGKPTSFQTVFGKISVNQLQVTCKKCKKRMFITRHLLGLEKRVVTSSRTERMLALIGSLTPYRVAEKITAMFGVKLGRTAIWLCLQKEGSKIEFGLDSEELAAGEADGTGVPTIGVKKRGRELKVFVQKKKGGGIRVAGLSIGNYDSGWDKLFKPLLKQFEDFKQFLLVTDGDTNILKGLGGKVKIIFQRCLWHIPHQLKYYLWQDGVKHKSAEWLSVISEALQICSVKYSNECDDVLAKIIEDKKLRLNNLIDFCINNEYYKCARYLKNAAPDMFSSIEERLNGKTTSLVERVMKTVNFRINVGKWSEEGALNVNKIRLAYYYNGYDVKPFDAEGIAIKKVCNKTDKTISRETKRTDE